MSDVDQDYGPIKVILFGVLMFVLGCALGVANTRDGIFRKLERIGIYASGDRRIIGKIEYRVDSWQDQPTANGDRK